MLGLGSGTGRSGLFLGQSAGARRSPGETARGRGQARDRKEGGSGLYGAPTGFQQYARQSEKIEDGARTR